MGAAVELVLAKYTDEEPSTCSLIILDTIFKRVPSLVASSTNFNVWLRVASPAGNNSPDTEASPRMVPVEPTLVVVAEPCQIPTNVD